MDPAEIRKRILEAVEQGRIPKGGPSELAAYDLTDDAPQHYWRRWSEETVERIREQMRRAK